MTPLRKVLFAILTLALLVPPHTARATTGGTTYVAQKGDTFAALSWKYGVSFDRLLSANGLVRNGDALDSKRFWLSSGQTVTIPIDLTSTPSLVSPFNYVVQRGDTLGLLSTRFEIAAWAVVKANGLTDYATFSGQSIATVDLKKPLAANTTLLIPAGPHIHKLAAKETVADVGKQYGVSEAYLLKVNNLAQPVPVGTLITIPVQYDRALVTALTATAPSGPFALRWVGQGSAWRMAETGPTATFHVEFIGGQGPFKLWSPQWGNIAFQGPFSHTDNGETWQRIEFTVTAKCGETFTLEPNLTDSTGANVWTLRTFTADCQ